MIFYNKQWCRVEMLITNSRFERFNPQNPSERFPSLGEEWGKIRDWARFYFTAAIIFFLHTVRPNQQFKHSGVLYIFLNLNICVPAEQLLYSHICHYVELTFLNHRFHIDLWQMATLKEELHDGFHFIQAPVCTLKNVHTFFFVTVCRLFKWLVCPHFSPFFLPCFLSCANERSPLSVIVYLNWLVMRR